MFMLRSLIALALGAILLPPSAIASDRTNLLLIIADDCTYYDWQVGELLRLLDKHGLADNTLVIVLSEQGNSFPFAKWTCYEAGLQSGVIARWPGRIKPSTVTGAMVEYVDITPTFLDATGTAIPAVIEGQSFLNVLEGDPWNLVNLAGDPDLTTIRSDLSNQLDDWMRRQGDPGQATELSAREHQGRARRKK